MNGCRKSVQARGYCSMHYQRWRTHGSTDKPTRKKVPIPHGTLHGYNYHKCRCDRCVQTLYDYERKWRRANPDKLRQYHRAQALKKYGITLEEFEAVLEAQGGGCAICGQSVTDGRKRHLEVDHCHKSHAIRGVLCNKCNSGLGYFDDDPERLREAAGYLERRAA